MNLGDCLDWGLLSLRFWVHSSVLIWDFWHTSYPSPCLLRNDCSTVCEFVPCYLLFLFDPFLNSIEIDQCGVLRCISNSGLVPFQLHLSNSSVYISAPRHHYCFWPFLLHVLVKRMFNSSSHCQSQNRIYQTSHLNSFLHCKYRCSAFKPVSLCLKVDLLTNQTSRMKTDLNTHTP